MRPSPGKALYPAATCKPPKPPSDSVGFGKRWTEAHHVTHWADGGGTSLDNCLLLCRHHHDLVHEGGWRIVWWGSGLPVFVDKRGGIHGEFRPAPPRLAADPVRALERDNALSGAAPDAWTAATRRRTADVRENTVRGAADAVLCESVAPGLPTAAPEGRPEVPSPAG